ncbi:MAG: hypothetical protein WAT79_08995 [Saprospiraceae bacterium]
MYLREDPLKNNPDRAEIRLRCNILLTDGLFEFLNSKDDKTKDLAIIKIEEALQYKYGDAHYTVKFRQTDKRNNEAIEKLINEAIIDL